FVKVCPEGREKPCLGRPRNAGLWRRRWLVGRRRFRSGWRWRGEIGRGGRRRWWGRGVAERLRNRAAVVRNEVVVSTEGAPIARNGRRARIVRRGGIFFARDRKIEERRMKTRVVQ